MYTMKIACVKGLQGFFSLDEDRETALSKAKETLKANASARIKDVAIFSDANGEQADMQGTEFIRAELKALYAPVEEKK